MMNTLEELEAYLDKNCYSFLGLSIGNHRAPEGIVIEKCNEKFIYAYSERGNQYLIKSFGTEKELVQYALTELMKDEWLKAHIVASTFEYKEILEAEKQLVDRKIKFKRNDIPNYRVGRTAYRIFVFGTDILKLDGFKEKYLHSLRV